jgi:3-deoxy-7-phosphoheptulonate synthase
MATIGEKNKMIIIMKQDATKEQVEAVIRRVKEAGLEVHLSEGKDKTVIGLVGDTEKMIDVPFRGFDGVSDTVRVTSTYKLTSREFHPTDTIVDVDGLKIGGDEDFVTMAGPCSIEGLDQIMECARIAKAGGATVLRGEGLKYIREAADKFDMKVITEVMDEANLELVAKYTDILQIGARNMQNFKLLQAVGKTGLPVALKRGISGTIDEWLNAAEYIAAAGNQKVIFVERGIRTYETATRNTLDLSAVPVIQKLSHFPIIVDPSHGVGVWDYVTPMAVAGVASGASGMIVEIHPEPNKAWSDGQQSLNEKRYMNMMEQVDVMAEAMKKVKEIREKI